MCHFFPNFDIFAAFVFTGLTDESLMPSPNVAMPRRCHATTCLAGCQQTVVSEYTHTSLSAGQQSALVEAFGLLSIRQHNGISVGSVLLVNEERVAGMARYGMVWYGTVRYGTVRYDMARVGMVWHGMVWYGMVWYGMVWYGMVWYGEVWYGMVWYGMVWYGMVPLFNGYGRGGGGLIHSNTC